MITASGTDAGVHKLVAAGLRDLGVKRPVIGVAPFRTAAGWNLASTLPEDSAPSASLHHLKARRPLLCTPERRLSSLDACGGPAPAARLWPPQG